MGADLSDISCSLQFSRFVRIVSGGRLPQTFRDIDCVWARERGSSYPADRQTSLSFYDIIYEKRQHERTSAASRCHINSLISLYSQPTKNKIKHLKSVFRIVSQGVRDISGISRPIKNAAQNTSAVWKFWNRLVLLGSVDKLGDGCMECLIWFVFIYLFFGTLPSLEWLVFGNVFRRIMCERKIGNHTSAHWLFRTFYSSGLSLP